jgi:hypothetical protein
MKTRTTGDCKALSSIRTGTNNETFLSSRSFAMRACSAAENSLRSRRPDDKTRRLLVGCE